MFKVIGNKFIDPNYDEGQAVVPAELLEDLERRGTVKIRRDNNTGSSGEPVKKKCC